jgi:hypothetical protein
MAGMTAEQIKYVMWSYSETLKSSYLDDEWPGNYLVESMIPRGLEIPDEKLDKLNRWLGFMQGVLWTMELFTVAELKEHNTTGKGLIGDGQVHSST